MRLCVVLTGGVVGVADCDGLVGTAVGPVVDKSNENKKRNSNQNVLISQPCSNKAAK